MNSSSCSLVLFLLICFSASKVKAIEPDKEESLRSRLEKMADSLTTHLMPWEIPPGIFKVEDFGARGDGSTMNTVAIQKTIDACSSAGGGVVLFSSGDYLTGTIVLKPGVMIEVEKDSRILGSTSINDYPEMKESFKSIMSEFYQFRQSLIYAEKCDHIGIMGKGEIYFGGEKVYFPGTPDNPGKIEGRPLGIRIIECTHVLIKNITLRNAAAWMQNYLCCENLIFDSIKVINHANYNNDGLDIDGCRNIIIRNCFINAEDDALCFKGAGNRLTENILIENCTFVSTCNAFKIGTDTQGSFRNIIARNLILGGIPDSLESSRGHESSTGVTLATVDGGDVEQIWLANLVINQARCPVFLRVGNRGRVVNGMLKPLPGHLRNIVIENIKGSHNRRQGSFISGIAGHPVEDIMIRNIKISMTGGGDSTMIDKTVEEKESGYPDAQEFSRTGLPAYGFTIRHARNINLENIRIKPLQYDARPAFKSGGDTEKVIVNGEEI